MRLIPFRGLLSVAPALLLVAALGACGGPGPAADDHPRGSATRTAASGSPPSPGAPTHALDALRQRFGARLGLYALDTGTGREIGYHADDRFAFDSTYKVLAVGALLRRVPDADLDRVITYRAADLQDYSPITRPRVSTGMTLRALMDAALRYSDNTAANLLLRRLGGPAALQRSLRAVGDSTTHVDRDEPSVNTAVPGDVRDTTTPRALGTDLRRFVLGDLLTGGRRRQLTDWMLHNTTGGPYVRAGVPAGWKVADKTGNGDYGSRNDIAVAWPAQGAPVVIAVLSARGQRDAASDDALIADATETALAALR
ncbi:class A beta-lactamase [Streptomyces sp. NBC_01497]|uniref:class A beta-lactamase n=1 Tax=Streptomyces sp. NBC_01497 TaxID=2903885 RepID=UPI002E375081|nr:class A beta-lactamase [Streptomyces sp. NBC_01497]